MWSTFPSWTLFQTSSENLIHNFEVPCTRSLWVEQILWRTRGGGKANFQVGYECSTTLRKISVNSSYGSNWVWESTPQMAAVSISYCFWSLPWTTGVDSNLPIGLAIWLVWREGVFKSKFLLIPICKSMAFSSSPISATCVSVCWDPNFPGSYCEFLDGWRDFMTLTSFTDHLQVLELCLTFPHFQPLVNIRSMALLESVNLSVDIIYDMQESEFWARIIIAFTTAPCLCKVTIFATGKGLWSNVWPLMFWLPMYVTTSNGAAGRKFHLISRQHSQRWGVIILFFSVASIPLLSQEYFSCALLDQWPHQISWRWKGWNRGQDTN